MNIDRYENMDGMTLDVLREIGSIGTGNAATALSGLLNEPVQMTVPQIDLREFNDAISLLGEAEELVAAVLVKMGGEIEGTMLFLLHLDFINAVLRHILGKDIHDFSQLQEMEISALTEIGNIIISSYTNAISTLAGVEINLSVPAIAVNMLGGILSVPMAEIGYETDKLLMINGTLIIQGKEHDSTILMLSDIESLNKLMNKLVGGYE